MSSFSLFLGGSSSSFKLEIELSHIPVPLDTLTLTWSDTDPLDCLKKKLQDQLVPFLLSQSSEYCFLDLTPTRDGAIHLNLSIENRQPKIERIYLDRVSGPGHCDSRYLSQALDLLPVDTIQHLVSHEGFPFFVPSVLSAPRWVALTYLSLLGCGLEALPKALGKLMELRELRLSRNKLTALPREIGQLKELQVLIVDRNELVVIPSQLNDCVRLCHLNLEHNKLNALVLDLQRFSLLHSLQLLGNPLSYIPELSVCQKLHSLSLENLRVISDPDYTQFQVTIHGQTSLDCGNKLNPLFSMLFSRSSSQHPLLAGALGRLAEFQSNCDAILELPGAPVQQLVLMALSPNAFVQEQAVKVIGLMVKSVQTAELLLKSGVLDAILPLLNHSRKETQIYAFKGLSSLALVSDGISALLLTPKLMEKLQQCLEDPNNVDALHSTLRTIGNLSFAIENKTLVLHRAEIMNKIKHLAAEGNNDQSKLLALRVLAILGENRELDRILKNPLMEHRGVRILSIDGGGMKGISALKMLEAIEQRTGRRIFELFDLIAGTSSGAMLAMSLGILKFTLQECDEIYKKLGYKVFNQAQEEEQTGWKDSLTRMYRSGQQGLRVVIAGCKHDASTFESLLKDFCNQLDDKDIGQLCIDTAVLGGPKVFATSTLTSITPAVPFIFRNYELPATSKSKGINSCQGSSKYEIWQGIRASSAAPYFFEDFTLDGLHFQDGATTANNPAAIAVEQARLLWPESPIECLVSLGLGAVPSGPREKSSSSFIENGSVLIESSCSVERVDEILNTMSDMVPGMDYFRFNPLDKRCDLALDGLQPEKWSKLEEATQDYILKKAPLFDTLSKILTRVDHEQQENGSNVGKLHKTEQCSVLFVTNTGRSEQSMSTPLQLMDYCLGSVDTMKQAFYPNHNFWKPHLSDASRVPVHSEGKSAWDFLRKMLNEVHANLNTLHLDLETTSDQSAFILTWKSILWTLQTNSSEAKTLALALNYSDEKSFLIALQKKPQFQYQDSHYELLAKHESYIAGHTIDTSSTLSSTTFSSLLIFRRLDPKELLTAEKLHDMCALFHGLSIICMHPISSLLVETLWKCGSQVIIHPKMPISLSQEMTKATTEYSGESHGHDCSVSFHEMASFFNVFYNSLSTVVDIDLCLENTSEKDFTSLKGLFAASHKP